MIPIVRTVSIHTLLQSELCGRKFYVSHSEGFGGASGPLGSTTIPLPDEITFYGVDTYESHELFNGDKTPPGWAIKGSYKNITIEANVSDEKELDEILAVMGLPSWYDLSNPKETRTLSSRVTVTVKDIVGCVHHEAFIGYTKDGKGEWIGNLGLDVDAKVTITSIKCDPNSLFKFSMHGVCGTTRVCAMFMTHDAFNNTLGQFGMPYLLLG